MESLDSYKYTASICCLYKNESLHMLEWIEYHRLIGIQHFYLYNNRSDDDIQVKYKDGQESKQTFREAIIEYYTKLGLLTHNEYDIDLAKSNFAALQNTKDYPFNHCTRNYGSESKWIAYIDMDEFITIKNEGKNIVDVLNNNFEKIDRICLNSLVYGSSGHYFNPDGLIVDSYNLRRLNLDPYIKSFVKPSVVNAHNGPHVVVCKEGTVVSDGSGKIITPRPVLHGTINPIIVLNHYICKSLWYWLKIKLSRVFSLKELQDMESPQKIIDQNVKGTLKGNYTKNVTKWQNYNNGQYNAVYDNSLNIFKEPILKQIETLPFYNISTEDFDIFGLNPLDRYDKLSSWINYEESNITNNMKNYFLFGSELEIKDLIVDVSTAWFSEEYLKAISSEESKLLVCNSRFAGIFYHGWFHGFIKYFHDEVIRFYIHLIYGNLPKGILSTDPRKDNHTTHQWFIKNII